jgi:hypothetical protein
MLINRRAAMTALFGAGLVGLRSLATGLPASFLLNPRRAIADGNCFSADKAQFLIMNANASGDPISCNTPGTYVDPMIMHPKGPTMTPTSLSLRGQQYVAAQPWSKLAQPILDRTCFFHHTTLTPVHGDQPNVMALMGAVKNNEMLASLVAKNLAPCLGTIQAEPVNIDGDPGSEYLKFEGRPLPIVSPTGLRDLLVDPAGPLTNLEKIRDADLKRLSDLAARDGTTAHKKFLDRFAISQQQARSISQDILGELHNIDKDPNADVTTAVLLVRMKVSPVVSIHLPFGGDNHGDPALAGESSDLNASLAALQVMFTKLATAGLQDKVTFLSLNVFGRTMVGEGNGRDHNQNHHCAVIVGKGIAGGVIGGVAPKDGDYGATAIASQTGASAASGDIPFEETLGALGKTLGAAMGLDPTVLDAQIQTGKIVTAALA